jgi:hypothetical protein
MPNEDGTKTREEKDKEREIEELDPSSVTMDESKLVGSRFKGLVATVKTTNEYQLDAEGNAQKDKGKFPYVTCSLETDFLDEGEYIRWKWKISNSKMGMHAKVLDALKKVRVLESDGTDTGIVGLSLENIMQLQNQVFTFERRDIEFGKDSEGHPIVVSNFPIPVEYINPPKEEVAEVKPAPVKPALKAGGLVGKK